MSLKYFNLKTLKHGFVLALLTISNSFAFADLQTDFNIMLKQEKGPFGPNVLAGVDELVTITDVSKGIKTTPNPTLFLAAFRNESAQNLIDQYNMYVGNLFTTNYMYIHDLFVPAEQRGKSRFNSSQLLESSADSINLSATMVKHWVLEKHYISQFPDSKISRSFRLRGISGIEYELVYARKFFDYYFYGSQNNQEYQLPGSLLLKLSPISDSPSLQEARDLISSTYDSLIDVKKFEKSNKIVKEIYKIRNAIHNQLNESVIDSINTFNDQFKDFDQETTVNLLKIKEILTSYYNLDSSKIKELASKLKLNLIVKLTEEYRTSNYSIKKLLELSNTAVSSFKAGFNINDKNISEKAMLFSMISEFSAKEVLKKSDVKTIQQDSSEILLNCLYLDGFLTLDHLEYFVEEAKSNINNNTEFQKVIADAIEIGTDNLRLTFEKELAEWIQINPEMEYFIDNTIKSSSIQSLNQFLIKLR